MLTVSAGGETVTVADPVVASATPTKVVTFSDFTANGGNVGMMVPAAGLVGPRTGDPSGLVLSMKPKTSTKASSIPTTKGDANPLRLLRTVKGSNPPLRDFTIQGTDQGHLYNAMMVDSANGLTMSRIKVLAIPGSFDPQGGSNPPWETNGLELYRCTGCTVEDYEADGQGVAATGLSMNFGQGNTWSRVHVHDCPYSFPTLYQTVDPTIEELASENNRLGLNFESVTGKVRVSKTRLTVPARDKQMHMTWNSSLGDCKDAVIQLDGWSGGNYGPNSPLCLAWGDTYQSKKNTNVTPPTILGPDGEPLQWAEAGHAANSALGIPATAAKNVDKAKADPLHWVVRFR